MTAAPRTSRRERVHRVLLVTLIGLLAAFSVWCLWLLLQAERLRGELDRDFSWIAEIDAVRAELEDLQEAGPGADATVFDSGLLGEFRRRSAELARSSGDPALQVAAQRLRAALEPRLDSTPAAAEGQDSALWSASASALAAVDVLETHLRRHMLSVHDRLGAHWRSLYGLVVGSLLLAASNLGLLILVHRRRQALEEAHGEALRHASHDALTGLWNREGILRLLGHELVRSVRSRAPLSVVLADLDRFREVNELLGQDQGDFILEQVGRRLRSLVRPYDTIGRFGGDSFLVVLPSCDATATERIVERLRAAVDDRDVEHAFGHLRVTVSLAHRTVDRPAETDVDRLLRELQDDLTATKAQGERPPMIGP